MVYFNKQSVGDFPDKRQTARIDMAQVVGICGRLSPGETRELLETRGSCFAHSLAA